MKLLSSWICYCNAGRAQYAFFVFISWLQNLCCSWNGNICRSLVHKRLVNLRIEGFARGTIFFKADA